MFFTADAWGQKRLVWPNGTLSAPISPPSVFHMAFLVDQRVNHVKDMTPEQALNELVPAEHRESVRAELCRWHGEKSKWARVKPEAMSMDTPD